MTTPENPDGSVGEWLTPSFVPQAIMSGDHKHEYSQIRVPVLAFVGSPKLRHGNSVTPSLKRLLGATREGRRSPAFAGTFVAGDAEALGSDAVSHRVIVVRGLIAY